MAKFDTSTIEGYAEMTPEQKIAALEAIEMPEPDYTGWVKKDVLDKTASDLAEWKRKYNSTLSEAEQAKQAAEEAQKATNDRLAELERKDKIATAKDAYIASGFDVALALATAEAEVDGKMDVVRANFVKHTENMKAALKDEAIKKVPAPPAGDPKLPDVDYAAEQAKAMADGNPALAAYYARMQATQNKKK